MNTKKVIGVIPARYASTRFPGKPLAKICGRPMIQWVYEKATQTRMLDSVIVATDDMRIMECVHNFGGIAVMTAENHPTGTDRIAEAIKDTDAELIVNLQGDEPLIPSDMIDELIKKSIQTNADMATVAVPIQASSDALNDPNVVKVVTDNNGFAMYFSRSLIPYHRKGGEFCTPLKHWGIYAYTRKTLEQFVVWPEGRLEKSEKLEQLRALEQGVKIFVLVADRQAIGVDHPEDIKKVEDLIVNNIK